VTAVGQYYLLMVMLFIDGYLEGVNCRPPGCVPFVGCESWFTTCL